MLRINFEIEGEKQVSRALGLLIDHTSDLRPVWPRIRDDFIANERKQFSSEGRHGSGGWTPLSAKYAAWKARVAPGKPILELSGALRQSLTGGSGFIYRTGRQSLAIGTKIPHARYHQTGTRRMPRRAPVELTEAQKTSWMKILHEYIWKNVGRGRVSL